LGRLKLAGGVENDWNLIKRLNLVCICVIFVLGHAGVRGNELADRFHGTAVISDGRAMDHADVLHALREAGKVEASLGDDKSNTMERLRDKFGAAIYEHYAGSQRRMVN
jgi:hypothetical protein